MQQSRRTAAGAGHVKPIGPSHCGPNSILTGQQPRNGRRPVLVEARARLFPQREWQVVVVNVSVGGFCCECDAGAAAGSQMILQIEGLGQFPALVRWSSGNRFGARFNGRMGLPEKELIAALIRSSRKDRLDDSAPSSAGQISQGEN